jgi:3-oxoacyl-[acyl-carrier protein] reductase
MSQRRKGKVAVVTGASKGIVVSIAKHLADEGAAVVVRSLAKELGPRNIRVNSINPGLVETEGTTSAGTTAAESGFRKLFESHAQLGRIGQPQDIGPAAVFLASDDSRWITGETLYIAGGYR